MRKLYALLLTVIFSASFIGAHCEDGCTECAECQQKEQKEAPIFKAEESENYTVFSEWSDSEFDATDEEFKELFLDGFLKMGFIEKKEDVTFSRTAVFVKNKKGPCACEKKSPAWMQHLPHDIALGTSLPLPQTPISGPLGSRDNPKTPGCLDCEDNCYWAAEAIHAGCACLKSYRAVMLCVTFVYKAKNACLNCCQDKGFVNNCIDPIVRLIPGDPMECN